MTDPQSATPLPATTAEPASNGTAKHAVHKHRGGFLDDWRDTWFGIFILMIIAAALGALLSRLWPAGESGFLTASGEMAEKVQALEAQVLQLTNAPRGAESEDLTAIKARMTSLEDRVKAAETLLAAGTPSSDTLASAVEPAQTEPSTPTPGTAPGAPPVVPLAPPADTAKLDGAVKALEDLQTRLAALEIAAKAAPASGAAPALPPPAASPGVELGSGDLGVSASLAPSDLQQVKDSIADLTKRIEDMQTKLTQSADPVTLVAEVKTEIAAVEGRVAKIEQADLAGSSKRVALGAAVASLTRAANGGQPFKAELDVIAGLAPGDPTTAELAPFAAQGVPVLSSLIASFRTRADAARAAERDANAGEGLSRLVSGLSSVVSVRATGSPNGSDTASILARAETKLRSGDLTAALSETSKLSGPARAAMAPWIADAQARLKTETALTSLNTRVVQSLTQAAAQ
ncbi:MAG TPA: hypothetical protein DCL54_13595 [Alphaproteobacteria bacterium]|nr:hypothetical protein [Alphaproteobacteria bacterium]HAJ47602.1 hypothetical protein [Alphaproteobacteria bacterium]